MEIAMKTSFNLFMLILLVLCAWAIIFAVSHLNGAIKEIIEIRRELREYEKKKTKTIAKIKKSIREMK